MKTTTKTTKTTKQAAEKTAAAVRSGAERTAAKTADAAKAGARKTKEAAAKTADAVHDVAQALLATDLADTLNSALASLASGTATVYDKAMDAEYLATHLGGGLHRLFDGGHTLAGAAKAAFTVETDDGVLGRAAGLTAGLFKDATTPAGLPLFTWTRDGYDQAADFMKDTFGVSKAAFADLATYDAAELLGGLVGSAALLLRWSDGDAKDFGRIVASSGVASAMALNPLLGAVAFAALVKAFAEARRADQSYATAAKEFAAGAARGSFFPLVALVGGPASVVLLATLLAAGFARRKNPELTPQLLALAKTAAGEAAHRLRRNAPRPIPRSVAS